MKQAFRAIACCIALALLAGCRSASSLPASSGDVSSQAFSEASSDVSSASSAPSSQAAPDASSRTAASAASSAGVHASSAVWDGDAFDAMMDALEGYEPGTAGASLKLARAACGVLNFSEGYDDGLEQTLRTELTARLKEMGEAETAQLSDCFPDVDAAAQEILTQGTQALSDVLADAGNPNLYPSYDAGRYEAVADLLHNMLKSAV